jgi:integrase
VFPAARCDVARDGCRGRHHGHESVVQRAVKAAGARRGIGTRATCHTFRRSFATPLLEGGLRHPHLPELLSHKAVRATTGYTHGLNRGGLGVHSLVDHLGPRLAARGIRASLLREGYSSRSICTG